jgi:uncharacterized protein YdhG (YjbR/CyaY superfamily)
VEVDVETPAAKKAGRSPADAVRSYLASLPPAARRNVQQVRETIRTAAPDAVEGVAYGIIGYKLDGRMLLYCAGWEKHTAVYPLTAGIRHALGPAVAKYASGKGTIKFPADKPIPVTLLKRIVKARAGEVRAKGAR